MADEEGVVRPEQLKVPRRRAAVVGGARTGSGDDDSNVVAGVGGHDLGGGEGAVGLLQPAVLVMDHHRRCLRRLTVPHMDRSMELVVRPSRSPTQIIGI